MPLSAAQERTTTPHPLAPLAAPFIWFCLRSGLPATFFTLLSLPLALAALLLLVEGHFLWSLPVVFAAAGADAVDGAVARKRGQASSAGGYLDSMMDRLVDLLVLLGIMLAAGEPRAWVAGTLALFGTLTTSAAKWRLQQERPETPLGRDPFSRTDRYIVILAGLLVIGLLGQTHQAMAIFILLLVLAVATNLSVLVNTWRAWRTLRA
jgi:phosphatidylglycerophosphate synthase